MGVARRAPGDRTPPIGCVRGVVPSKKSSRACSSGGSTGKASRHNGQEFVSPSHFEMHSSWNKCWHGIRATVSSEWNSSVQTAHTLQPSAPREDISCGAVVHGERGSCSTALHHRATSVSAVLYPGTLIHRWMNVPAGRRQVGSRACSGLVKYTSHQRSLRVESVRVQLSAVDRLTAGGTGTPGGQGPPPAIRSPVVTPRWRARTGAWSPRRAGSRSQTRCCCHASRCSRVALPSGQQPRQPRSRLDSLLRHFFKVLQRRRSKREAPRIADSGSDCGASASGGAWRSFDPSPPARDGQRGRKDPRPGAATGAGQVGGRRNQGGCGGEGHLRRRMLLGRRARYMCNPTSLLSVVDPSDVWCA